MIPDHITKAYEVLVNLLGQRRITAIVDVDTVIVNLPDDASVRVTHPEARADGSAEGWLIEYGHAEDHNRRMMIMGRPGISFADITELTTIAVRLTQLQAYPER